MPARHIFTSCLLIFLFFASNAFSLPEHLTSRGEKFVLVDTNEHRFGAYDKQGNLIYQGMASAGADWCEDMNSPCPTDIGEFRIRTLGSRTCVSPSFPLPNGGAPMPYCMYFNKYQALHGSYHVVDGNISHGCVRMHVDDAKWLRYHFATIGTLVIIQ